MKSLGLKAVLKALAILVIPPILAVPLTATAGEKPVLELECHPAVAGVGDIVSLTGKLSLPEGWQLEQVLSNGGDPDLAVEPVTLVSNRNGARPGTVFWESSIQVFAIHDAMLPSFVFHVRTPEGEERHFRSGGFPLPVQPPMVDMKKKPVIRGMQGPLELPSSFPWLWILIPALLLFSGAGIWYYRKRKAAREQLPGMQEIEDPWDLVLRRLEGIEKYSLKTDEERREFFFLLTETLRMYLTGRNEGQFLEATTREIGSKLENCAWIEAEARNTLLDLLKKADLVKFAKMPVAETACLDFFENIKNWMEAQEKAFWQHKQRQDAPETADNRDGQNGEGEA